MKASTWVLAGAALLAACATAESAEREEAAPQGGETQQGSMQAQGGETQQGSMQAQMAESCPMHVPGAQLQVREPEGGVALHFTTDDPGQVTEVRRRVRKEAAMMARHHQMRHGPEGMQGGMMHGKGGMMHGEGAMQPGGAQPQEGDPGAMEEGATHQGEVQPGEDPAHGQMPPGEGMGQMHEGMMESEAELTGPVDLDLPGLSIHVEDVEGGAQLLLEPEDPQRLEMMRQRLRAHAEGGQQGTCPMEEMMRQSAEGSG